VFGASLSNYLSELRIGRKVAGKTKHSFYTQYPLIVSLRIKGLAYTVSQNSRTIGLTLNFILEALAHSTRLLYAV
jgi:hypothetical protein